MFQRLPVAADFEGSRKRLKTAKAYLRVTVVVHLFGSLDSLHMTSLNFAKLVVLINALVPGVLLLADAFRGELGADPVKYAIRTTGFLSITFLALCLAVSPLKRLTGYGKLIAFRKTLGLFAFWYVLAHFLLFFIGDRGGSVAGTIDEMINRKYLIIGSAGLIILAILAVTSPNRMIRALGSVTWKRLHKLVYVAAVAGTIHYYMAAKADITWPVAFAIVFGVLLGLRVVFYILDRNHKPANKLATARG